MVSSPQRIIIDTNLWISFLISRSYSKLDKLLVSGFAKLIFSAELIEEFMEVVKRPKFRKIFSYPEVESLMSDINKYADFVEIKSAPISCRDSKDNFLLALCIDGNADYLLTGDEDLLILKTCGKTKIITLSEYLDNLKPS